MKIGVLALQGGFIEHTEKLKVMGAEVVLIRNKDEMEESLSGIVLPGGESTVQRKLIENTGLYESLKAMIESGIPVIGTCAGLILLSRIVDGEDGYFKTLPVTVTRNGYGRQSGSFSVMGDIKSVGLRPMTFIRAPVIEGIESGVEILASVGEKPVAVKYKNQYGLTFHPELESYKDAGWIYSLAFSL